jgi:hypothetical protein
VGAQEFAFPAGCLVTVRLLGFSSAGHDAFACCVYPLLKGTSSTCHAVKETRSKIDEATWNLTNN